MTTIERDVLIGRVVDGVATGADWAALEAAAQADAGVWRELALAQREHAALSCAVGAAAAAAERVELPIGGGAAGPDAWRFGALRGWGGWGWAAAAAVALAWGGTSGGLSAVDVLDRGRDGGMGGGVLQAGLMPINTVDDAVRAYLEKGRESGVVVGEVPRRVLVDTRQAPDGEGYEVTYLRQFVERVVVTDLYRRSLDEEGVVRLVPVSAPAETSGPF